jgi:hypothetical protein
VLPQTARKCSFPLSNISPRCKMMEGSTASHHAKISIGHCWILGKKRFQPIEKKEKQKEDSVIERGENVGEWNAEIKRCWWQHCPPSKKK